MEAAHTKGAFGITFKEEALRLRFESKNLRQENARFKKRSGNLLIKILRIEQENLVLKKGNLFLNQRQLLLLEKQQQLQKQIESLTLTIQELRRMVFGKKKIKGNGDKSSEGTNINSGQTNKRKSANRTNDSYRRATPKDAEVTDTHIQ